MIEKKFKNIKTVIISVGSGAGSKYLQSFFDDHEEVLMTPGYILMYLLPHWKEWEKKNLYTWKSYINLLLSYHPSLIDTNKLSGSSNFNKLGEKKNKSIKINKKKFVKNIFFFLKNEEINFKNFVLGIHLAYAKTKNENLNKKKVFIYHVHVPFYVSEIYKHFPKAKILSMMRELKSNAIKRVKNSFYNINSVYLNKTDAIYFAAIGYKNSIKINLNGLICLKKIEHKNQRVILHEDLILRNKEVLTNTAKFIGISKRKKLFKSSFGGMKWENDFYKMGKLIRGFNFNILKFNREEHFWHELFWYEGINFKLYKKYNYKFKFIKNYSFIKIFFIIFFIILPSKIEIKNFFSLLNLSKIIYFFSYSFSEAFYPSKLKKYEKIAFYKHKWTHKNFPFYFYNFFIKKLKSSNNYGWKIIYLFIKLFQYIYLPICVLKEYLYRILICLKYYITILSTDVKFPKKL